MAIARRPGTSLTPGAPALARLPADTFRSFTAAGKGSAVDGVGLGFLVFLFPVVTAAGAECVPFWTF